MPCKVSLNSSNSFLLISPRARRSPAMSIALFESCPAPPVGELILLMLQATIPQAPAQKMRQHTVQKAIHHIFLLLNHLLAE